MAERIEIKTVAIPAGTAVAAPQKTDLVWRQGVPLRVELRIPPGPAGLVGVALAHSSTKIIPHDETEWLITDNEPVKWPLSGYPTNTGWQLWAYNLDVYDHVVQVRMLMDELNTATVTETTVPPIVQQLESAGIGAEGVSA